MTSHLKTRSHRPPRPVLVSALIAALALPLSTVQALAAGACDAECSLYRQAKTPANLNVCVQTPMPTPTPDLCKYPVSVWNQVAPHCDAIELSDKTDAEQKKAATAYIAAAGACWAACYFPPANPACQIAGGAAAILDILGTLKLMKDGKDMMDGLGGIMGLAGTAGGAFAGYTAVTGKVSSVPGTNGKTNHKAENACKAAMIFTGIAALKWFSMSQNKHNTKSECETIKGLLSASTPTTNATPTPTATYAGYAPSGGGTGGSGGGTGGRTGGIAGTNSTAQGVNLADPNNPYVRAASAGPGGSLLSRLGDKDKATQLANDKLGLNADRVGNALSNGQGPGSILGSMPGMPDGFADAMKEIDEAALAGRLTAGDASGVYSAAGGASRAAASTAGENPFAALNFGANPSAGPGAPDALTFSGAKLEDEGAESTDIWHTGVKETLFEIVSKRVSRNRGKLLERDWALPLNREFSRLPARNH